MQTKLIAMILGVALVLATAATLMTTGQAFAARHVGGTFADSGGNGGVSQTGGTATAWTTGGGEQIILVATGVHNTGSGT